MEGSVERSIRNTEFITVGDTSGEPAEHQDGSGISSQLAPEFSRKLSFVECDNEIDIGAQRGISDMGTERIVPQLPDVTSQPASGDRLMADTASVATGTTEVAAEENKQPFVCPCGEKFVKSVHLAAHKRWSCPLTEKTAQCDLCKNWFASDMGLKRHMKHAHGGMFSCDSCSLRFPNKIKLTRHWMEAHYNENEGRSKTLKCYECGEANFDSKVELEFHLVFHKYEKHQQKISQHASESHHSGIHFSPYPSPPCLRAMRHPHPHPFHHHFGFGHPWSHFPIRPPPPPLFPFMPFSPYARFRPGPPPVPMQIPTNANPFSSRQGDDSSIKSTPETSIFHETSKTASDEFSARAARTAEMPSHTPHHNHEYFEPTAFPPYFMHHFDHFKHRYHHHNIRHHEKRKWKKYLKLMMKGKVPPLWAGPVPMQDLDTEVHENQGGSTGQDKSTNNCEFKMACKFCDKIIEKNKVSWHQRKECPVLAAHRCAVCDRVFKKRHFLIRHMHEQNHFLTGASGGVQTDNSEGVDPSSLSGLQEKMNASLKLNIPEDLEESETVEMDQSAGQMTACSLGSYKEGSESQPEMQSKERLDTGHNKENRRRIPALSREEADRVACEHLQCSTCKRVCQSLENLTEHLREHINQVLAIQKVREWTSKSSEYFFIEHNEDEDELEGEGSTSTATTSYFDSENTSLAGSTLPDLGSNFSSLETTGSKDPKWTKPHKKRSKNHHKGEINICEFCGEKFAFRKDLRYHMEANHKDSTLECPVCRKKFSWKKRGKFYERHLNSHYGVKVFKHKCDACGKTFLENSKLRAHMSLHNNELLHKCTVCGKGYANKSSLVRHERKHTGVKPYQCKICQEGFLEKRELLRHSTTHTGVSPFSCSECGHGFTLKTSLMSHMKKKHSEKEKPL